MKKIGKKIIVGFMSLLMMLNIVSSPLYSNTGDTVSTTTNQMLEQEAEKYYGENGTLAAASLTVAWADSDSAAEQIKAGATINLSLSWALQPAATYNYGTQQEPLFDTYDHTKITIMLPDGVSIIEDFSQLESVDEILHEGNKWILVMSPSIDAKSGSNGAIAVPLKIEGNGSRAIGETLDFSNIDAKISTEFTVLDRTDPDHVVEFKKYSKTYSSSSTIQDKVTYTDDIWGIKKSAVEATPDENKETVTATFTLTLGLLDGTDSIIVNESSYERQGRVPFEGDVTLIEHPVVKDRDGNEITATSITVTPNFGEKQPVEVTKSGSKIILPVDTCGNNNLTNVDENAPYLSTYTVEVVYPYEKFIAYYYEDNQDLLDIDNEVVLDYYLKGDENLKSDESYATLQAGEVVQPVELTIEKYIINNDGAAKLYSATNFAKDPVSGPATFTITDENGDAATLYTKDDEGKYKELSGNIVSIDPAGTNTEGMVTVYLSPGTYTISETALPQNTEKNTGEFNAEDRTVTLTSGKEQTSFYNKELIGQVTVTKTARALDGSTSALQGATFAIYSDEECNTLIATGETNVSGTMTFDRLPYGTYYVKETAAPEGYVVDTQVYSITISKDKLIGSLENTNKLNQINVLLTKYMFNGVDNEGQYTYVQVDNKLYMEFANAFTIQQKVGDTWEDIEGKTDLSLTSSGTLSAVLPVVDEQGNFITYRFKEILPEGWHDPGNASANEMYSEKFTLKGQLEDNGTKEIDMYNTRNGSISLTKEFYDIGRTGYTKTTNSSPVTFTLYRGTTEDNITKYNDYVTNENGLLEIKDLELANDHNQPYNYYLVETPVNGYLADMDETVPIKVGEETLHAFGPFTFTENNGATVTLSKEITIKNYEQKVGIIVKKIDTQTKQFVAGSKFTIYDITNSSDLTEANVYLQETAISDANGVFVELELGKKYQIKETTIPQGYTDVTVKEHMIIDLENTEEVTKENSVQTYQLENKPDPKLLVLKSIQGNNTLTSPVKDIQFEVYIKVNDSFEQVKDYDGEKLIVTSSTAKQLPVGTYYLKEIVPQGNPNHVLDPSENIGLYKEFYNKLKEDDSTVEYLYETTADSFYFGPYTVTDSKVLSIPIRNLSSLGAVTVTKYALGVDGDEKPLAGAELSIYNEAKPDTIIQTLSSNSQGKVSFTNLPIYNDNGEKITYVIKETKAPSGYSISDDTIEVTLTPGETVTKDTTGQDLKLVNFPKMSFEVTKVFYNIWEYNFTNKEYLMSGAQIALFQKTGEDEYTFVEMGTTNQLGVVSFDGLNQKDEYVAVEYSIPNEDSYQYLEPENGHKYLSEDYASLNTEIKLTKEGLDNYYYVTKEALTENTPIATVKKTLTNVEHWTQLHIFKYLNVQDETTLEPEKKPINNAKFKLYMQVVDETTGSQLAFENDKLDQYQLIGEYSSGTLYDEKGIRQDGWFATNILKSADNVVYWLVEENPGIGAKIKPENQIILIIREGTSYTNVSTSLQQPGKTCSEVWTYTDDTVTKKEVENDPATGPGNAMYSTVRIAKWAGSLNEDGERNDTYTPLGNAVFDLYLVHEDGTIVEKLDTLTTGLDNDLSEIVPTGEKTAWASSKSFDFDTLLKNYEQYNVVGNNQDIIYKDDEGNGYVRVMLKEVSTPGGYDAPEEGYQMIMFFQNEAGETTEVFNDAYYVKDATSKEITLAENQGDTWAFYPTSENEDGTYEPISVNGVPSQQYRIVNWPVDNFAVTVNKYGYTVDENNLNMTSSELDEYYLNKEGRVPLQVTFKLQRYVNEQWTDYSYDGTNTTFITTNGYFAFPNGLAVGRYRLIETYAAAGYENLYDGSTLTDAYYNAKAYYFKVTNENVHLSIYNPKKLSMNVLKTSTDGSKLNGITFTLKGTSTITGTTNTEGIATLNNIGTGVYTISETATGASYSTKYFAQYLEEMNKDTDPVTVDGKTYQLSKFASEGIFFGYSSSFTGSAYEGEMIVTAMTTLNDYTDKADLTLEVQNPALCSLTITKQDAQATDTKLAGAQFKLEYQSFDSWNQNETITATDSWQTVKENQQTTADGTVTISNLEPGIYKVTETKAPDDYSLDSTPQYVVLTGGMSKTVTMNEESITSEPSLTFGDYKLVDLTITKTIDSGSLDVLEDHTFTFILKKDSKEVARKSVTFTAKGGKEQAITFENLEQGAAYTITEVADENFKLTKVTVNDVDTTFDDNTWTVDVPVDGQNVTVEATNTYLYGEIKILKVDANDGRGLTGAGFEAYRLVNDQPMTSNSGEVTELGEGEYLIRVPLTNTQGNTFRVQEISSPYGYLDEYPYADIEVKPGQIIVHGNYDPGTMHTEDREANDAKMLEKLIYPNYRGAVIELTKYDNMHGTTETPLEGATFTLYQQTNDGNWNQIASETTDENGSVRFTTTSGSIYALAETTVPTDYTGIEGIWDGNDQKLSTDQGDHILYHLLNDGKDLEKAKYTYKAYNVPMVELEVRKQDVLDPTKNSPPTAVVSVYEVPNGTSTTLTKDEVYTLMQQNAVVLHDVEVKTPASANNEWYSYANATTLASMGQNISAGKTYLIVETDSSMTQIRDHRDVVWYAVKAIPAGTKDKQVVTLKNIEGTASQTLAKTTSQENYDSLLGFAAELHYTITPTITNTYPLDSFILTDTGLTAFDSDNNELNYNAYLKDKYSITSITLKASTHNSAVYSGGTATDLKATITFYDFNDQVIQTSTVDATKDQTIQLKDTTKKAKYFKVTYSSPELKKASGYGIGQDFIAGKISVNILLDKQTGGEGVKAITKVTNTVETDMSYRTWDTKGTQGAVITDHKKASVSNTFKSLKTALVTFEKTVDVPTVNLNGGILTYTMTVTNLQEAEGNMGKPFIVDLLPQGTQLNGEDGNLKISGPEGVILENFRTETLNGETAVFIFMQGELKPGESATVTLEVESTNAAALYGTSIVNYAIVGSRVKGVQSADNPRSTSYKTAQGQWPSDMPGTLTTLKGERLETFKGLLGEMSAFGYIGDAIDVNWSTTLQSSLIKTGKGDRSEELGFTTDRLSTVNNDGYMEYQLIFTNLSETHTYTNATLIDVFPFVGDKIATSADRGSEWSMVFDQLLSMERINNKGEHVIVPPDSYKLYYYTDPIDNDNILDVYQDAKELKFESSSLPSGWTADANQAENATAFAIAVAKEEAVSIASGESYMATYRLNVGLLSEEELADRSWTNAVNNFSCAYEQYITSAGIGTATDYGISLLSSNSVSNTILPNTVKVGGHIWIDKDADGVWDEGESVADLSDDSIVRRLLDNVEVYLYTYEGNRNTSTKATRYDTADDTQWYTNANFIFDHLDPATIKDNFTEAQLYSNTELNNPLDPNALKGANAKTYNIAVVIPENANIPYRLTTLGGGDPDKQDIGYSRHPSDLLTNGAYEEEAYDNNYLTASARASVSERFYLHSTIESLFDNTKDIGFVLTRNLQIEKYAENDPTKPLEGAVFDIYGPFDTVEEANQAVLNNQTKLTTVTTDAYGKAEVKNLNWYQVYVIVESQSPDYYQLDGAKATNTDGVLVDYTGNATENPAWIFNVPGKDVINENQVVQVSNTTEIDYQIEVEKYLDGKELEDEQFSFELLDENGDPIPGAVAKNVNGKVTFGPFNVDSVGTTTYYVREVIPTSATDNVLNDILYDDTVYKVVVNVAINAQDHNRLDADILYYRQADHGTWQPVTDGIVFENVYLPSKTTYYQPKIMKQFSDDSDERSEKEQFTFLLKPIMDYGKAVVLPNAEGYLKTSVEDHGIAYFDSIQFNAEGTYRFILSEKNDGLDGYEYDDSLWILEVETKEVNDQLTVVRADYDTMDSGTQTYATFVNYYQEKKEEPPKDPNKEPEKKPEKEPEKESEETQTGEENNTTAWAFLSFLTFAAAGTMLYTKRRRNANDQNK